MANTETSVTELKINKLTKAQYEGIVSPSNTELYFVKDEAIDYNDLVNTPEFATVAFSGEYDDLHNKPEIKQADWNQQDSNEPDFIKNKPTIPTVTDSITQGSGAALTSGGAYTNVVTSVVAGSTADKLNVTKAGSTTTITIDNVENANTANNALTATTAVTATKLGSTTVGSGTKPIYINNGTALPINYTIEKSVPSDAVFTDTTYAPFNGATASTAGSNGLVKAPAAGDQNKYLRGDGQWAVVDALPSQSDKNGKFLKTNGTSASWENIPNEIPLQTGNSGKYLTTNGTSVSWATVDALPAQSGQSGKFLTTNGTTASWTSLSASDIPNLTLSKITDVTATATELNYVDGVTSSIQTQLNTKQPTLVSGTNIKTIDNQSLLGSGNISVRPVFTYDSSTETLTIS